MEVCADKRRDGRDGQQLRSIEVASGILSQPTGSASVSFGSTRVLAAVYGPKPLEWRQGYSKTGVISCDVKMSTGASKDASRIVKNVLETAIQLDAFPNACLEIQAVVLQSDGSELAAIINAISVAVAQSGIEMYDMITACHIVGLNGMLCVDPSEAELKEAEFEMILAAHPARNEACYFSMNGTLHDALMPIAMETCLKSCIEIRKALLNALS